MLEKLNRDLWGILKQRVMQISEAIPSKALRPREYSMIISPKLRMDRVKRCTYPLNSGPCSLKISHCIKFTESCLTAWTKTDAIASLHSTPH